MEQDRVMHKFGVITAVPGMGKPEALTDPTVDWEGNLALQVPLFTATGMVGDKPRIIQGIEAMAFRAPVFDIGEILVLDLDGREIGGRGRKPSKWDVKCEVFDDIEKAIERAREVS